jgi:hypothetical protein
MWNYVRTFIINVPNLPTMLAFRIVRRAIKKDAGYAEGWQSNIAMSIYDESRNQASGLDGKFCNRAAARFMKICFDVETSA